MNDITNFRLSKAANDVADKFTEHLPQNSRLLTRLRISMENLTLPRMLSPTAMVAITV